MTPTADKTNGIIITLYRWYSCLISSPDICNIFLSMSLADCGLKGLLCQWMELLCNPSRLCSCNFLEWVAAHIYNMQNMVSQEHECVLPLPDGKLWWPCHYYIIIIIDHSMLVIFTNDIPVEKHILKKYSARQGNVKYQRVNSSTSKCKLHVIKSLISYLLINWTVWNFTSKECKIYSRNASFSTIALRMKQYLMNATLPTSTFGVGRVNRRIKLILMILKMATGWDSIVSIATCWTVRGLNPSGSKIFCISPDHPWDPPRPPNNRYQVIPGGANWLRHGCAEVKDRLQLYL